MSFETGSKQPRDIAAQFKELLQLRKLVQEAELECLQNKSPRGEIQSEVDDKEGRRS